MIIVGLIPFLFLQSTSVFASKIGEVQGQVFNQSLNHLNGSELSIILHVFKLDKSLETFTGNTDASGQFSLQEVPLSEEHRYVISTNYMGIEYAKEISSQKLKESVELSVFNTTESIKALSIESHLWLIKDVDPKPRHILINEIVMVNNKENLVFKPNLHDPSKMNFLRFSLPVGFSDLHVETDVGRDTILDVGTGFGMTSPIPPGMHQIGFTYTIPYEKNQRTITRRFLQETSVLQVLFPINQGSIFSPNMEQVESPVIGDISYHAWAAQNVQAGSTVVVNLTDLSELSFTQMLFSRGNAKTYLTIVIPSILGLILSITLIMVSIGPLSRVLKNFNASTGQEFSNFESNSSLLYDIAYLDRAFELKTMSKNKYLTLRRQLVRVLLLRIERQELFWSGSYDDK